MIKPFKAIYHDYGVIHILKLSTMTIDELGMLLCICFYLYLSYNEENLSHRTLIAHLTENLRSDLF